MKKISGPLEEAAPCQPTSFKICDEKASSYLIVYLLRGQKTDDERFHAWLYKNHGITCKIDPTHSGVLVFKTAEMSALMGLYILKLGGYMVEHEFNAMDLARLIIKLKPSIANDKSPNIFLKLQAILAELYNHELSKFDLLSNIAQNLSLEGFSVPTPSELNRKNYFESSKSSLIDITHLLVISTKLCFKVLDKIVTTISFCNNIAHRATVAVEILKKVKEQHPMELLCLLNACFDGNVKIMEKMHTSANGVLSEYLRKFKLTKSMLEKCTQVKADIEHGHRSERILLSDSLNYRTQPVVKIHHHDISELASAVVQLDEVIQKAEFVLTSYDKLRSYAQQVPCIISPLLPDSSELISPLFHQYNAHTSPLIAALLDHKLDQEANLQLFRDLSKTMPYQQSKMNILIYGDHGPEFMSPLCFAVELAIPAVVRILLEHNATVNPVDNRKAPLQRAMTRGNCEIVQLLLEFGARPDMVTDDEHSTALHYAEDAECAGYLIDWVASRAAQYPNISLPRLIDALDRHGNTPLLRIAQKRVHEYKSRFERNNREHIQLKSRLHLRLLQLLVEKKADVNAVSLNGQSALQYALKVHSLKREDYAHFPTVMASVKLLLDAGANPNLQHNKSIPTPLHYCMRMTNGLKVAESQIQCLEHLLNAGANPLLLLEEKWDLRYENKMGINIFTNNSHNLNSHAMQVLLSQTNVFSAYETRLGPHKKDETIEERFMRIWTAMGVRTLTISVHMNALEFSQVLSHPNTGPHNRAVTLFNNWSNFHRSQNVKSLLSVMCHSLPWSYIPNDLVIIFAQQFSDNLGQIKLLKKWVFSARNLTKSRGNNTDTISSRALIAKNFYSQEDGEPSERKEANSLIRTLKDGHFF